MNKGSKNTFIFTLSLITILSFPLIISPYANILGKAFSMASKNANHKEILSLSEILNQRASVLDSLESELVLNSSENLEKLAHKELSSTENLILIKSGKVKLENLEEANYKLFEFSFTGDYESILKFLINPNFNNHNTSISRLRINKNQTTNTRSLIAELELMQITRR